MADLKVQDLVFAGGGGRVIALDRYDGSIRWQWKAKRRTGFLGALLPAGFLSVVFDTDRLVIASSKCVWCLDPLTGEEVWSAPDADFGNGSHPVVAVGGRTSAPEASASAAAADAAQAAALASLG